MSQFILGVGLTPPSSFTYDLPCKDVLQIGETVSCFPTLTVLAKSSGQDLCVWSVELALPSGLTFNPASGLISGCEK